MTANKYVCHVCTYESVFVGNCLATKVFIGTLPTMGGVWVTVNLINYLLVSTLLPRVPR